MTLEAGALMEAEGVMAVENDRPLFIVDLIRVYHGFNEEDVDTYVKRCLPLRNTRVHFSGTVCGGKFHPCPPGNKLRRYGLHRNQPRNTSDPSSLEATTEAPTEPSGASSVQSTSRTLSRFRKLTDSPSSPSLVKRKRRESPDLETVPETVPETPAGSQLLGELSDRDGC